MPRPTLLLANAHRATGEQLRTLLEPEFDVVALVADGLALVSAAAHFAPDVIVTGITMPGLDGIEAARVIRKSNPDARIVLVTAHCATILVECGLATGALGYVRKDSAGDQLGDAVRAALAGLRYVSRELLPVLARQRAV